MPHYFCPLPETSPQDANPIPRVHCCAPAQTSSIVFNLTLQKNYWSNSGIYPADEQAHIALAAHCMQLLFQIPFKNYGPQLGTETYGYRHGVLNVPPGPLFLMTAEQVKQVVVRTASDFLTSTRLSDTCSTAIPPGGGAWPFYSMQAGMSYARTYQFIAGSLYTETLDIKVQKVRFRFATPTAGIETTYSGCPATSVGVKQKRKSDVQFMLPSASVYIPTTQPNNVSAVRYSIFTPA